MLCRGAGENASCYISKYCSLDHYYNPCFGRVLEAVSLRQSHDIFPVLQILKSSSRWIVSLWLAGKLCPLTNHCHCGIRNVFFLSMTQLHKPKKICLYLSFKSHTNSQAYVTLTIFLVQKYTLGFRARIHRIECNVPTLWQERKEYMRD